MKRKGKCCFCFTAVKSGGDRHAVSKCSRRSAFGDRRRGKKSHKRVTAAEIPVRGVAVAGTGKPSASADKTKAKAKVAQA